MIRRITQALILITVAIWIAWDLYATHHPGATESEVIRDWQVAYPPLAWGIGVLFGHFTMLGNRLASRWILLPLSAAILFVSLVADLTWHWVPGLGVAGVIAGRVFWAQPPEGEKE